MSARKSAKPAKTHRRAARKAPRLIEIDGHQLSPEMVEKLHSAIEYRRGQQKPGDPHDRPARVGLSDVLWPHRPNQKATGRLVELYTRMGGVNLAVANMGRYPFSQEDGTIREAGCTLLRQLASEHVRAARILQHIAETIERERGAKLQDWITWDKALEGMERQFRLLPHSIAR